jgi:hypothetical protein
MREVILSAILSVFWTAIPLAQESAEPQPYDSADAYQIYSLLLPQEESHGFAKGTLMIQEETISHVAATGGCLPTEVAKQFTDAISDYERSRTKTWLLKRQFRIEKPYEIVSKQTLALLRGQGLDSWDDYFDRYPRSGGYVFLSPVGFNKKKTQAIVYTGSICGGLCGQAQFHVMEKNHGVWQEVPTGRCVTVS